MHEASLVEACFDQLRGYVPAGAVLRLVRVRLGALSGVEPELFRLAFELGREGAGYPAAALELETEAAVWACEACGVEVAGVAEACPVCDALPTLRAGASIVLVRLEYDDV